MNRCFWTGSSSVLASLIIAAGITIVGNAALGNTAPSSVLPSQEEESTVDAELPVDYRHILIGAITMGIGAFSTVAVGFVSLNLVSENGEYTDVSRNAWVGISLLVHPFIGIIAGTSVADRSPHYDYSTGAIVLGTYIGVAVALSSSLLYSYSNNPDVDGKYDGGYFSENRHNRRVLGRFFFHVAMPSILPGLGMLIAAYVSRKRKPKKKSVRFLPMPTVICYSDAKGARQRAPGLLLTVGF